MEDLEESFFTCEACRYTFIANEDVERCPDCGKVKVRKASSKDQKKLSSINGFGWKLHKKKIADKEKSGKEPTAMVCSFPIFFVC